MSSSVGFAGGHWLHSAGSSAGSWSSLFLFFFLFICSLVVSGPLPLCVAFPAGLLVLHGGLVLKRLQKQKQPGFLKA